MWDKPASSCFYVFISVTKWYEVHKMWDRVVSEDPFMLEYCLNRYKTQKMCDEAVDDRLLPLKFVPDCFFTDNLKRKSMRFYSLMMI